MSKPAGKTLIGIFVLGAIALAVVAVVVLGSGKFFQKTTKAVCYFEGSVGGLNVGAPVVFRGVKVGTVKDIVLRYDPNTASILIPVFLEIERGKPGEIPRLRPDQEFHRLIEKGLRARLDLQSFLTGQFQVGLDFYPDKPAKFVHADPGYIEFPTVRSPLQMLEKQVENIPIDEIFNKITSTLSGIERVVQSPEIPRAIQAIHDAAQEAKILVRNVNTKVAPVASDLELTARDAREVMRDIEAKVGPLSKSIDETVRELQGLVRNVNDQIQPLASRVNAIAGSMDEAAKEAQTLIKNVDSRIEPLTAGAEKALASMDKAVNEAGDALRQAKRTLASLEGDVGEDSEPVYQLNRTLRELRLTATALRDLLELLERQPQSVLFGKKRAGKEAR